MGSLNPWLGLFVLAVHVCLQLLGIYNQRTYHFVFFNEGVDEGRLLEEGIVKKGMQFVELHSVDAQLHIHCRLQQEVLFAFVSNELNGHAIELIQVFTSKFLNKQLGVRLYLVSGPQCPAIVLGRQIGKTEVVV